MLQTAYPSQAQPVLSPNTSLQEVTSCTVRFYMAVMLHDSSRMVVAFPDLRPRLALLMHVLKDLDSLESQPGPVAAQPVAGLSCSHKSLMDDWHKQIAPAQKLAVKCT